ncbi:14566_t:CDS:1, partial [Dentiscutata erythropus]
LFAIFLTVNAVSFQLNKRATTFNHCKGIPDSELLTVTINPDPLASNQSAQYNVSGTLTKYNITASQTFLGIFLQKGPYLISDGYNQAFDKSYNAGIAFTIFASNVSVPTLPDSYSIFVLVGVPASANSANSAIYGCAQALVGSV